MWHPESSLSPFEVSYWWLWSLHRSSESTWFVKAFSPWRNIFLTNTGHAPSSRLEDEAQRGRERGGRQTDRRVAPLERSVQHFLMMVPSLVPEMWGQLWRGLRPKWKCLEMCILKIAEYFLIRLNGRIQNPRAILQFLHCNSAKKS